MVDASEFHIWNEKWILTLPKTNQSPWEMSFFPGKCHQIWWIFWKYQSVPYPNLTKIGCLQPQKEEAESLPTINFSECLLLVLGSILDFRGRIAWLKIRCSKIRALNRLWKIACLNVPMYTSIIYTSSFLTFDSNIGNTPHLPLNWIIAWRTVRPLSCGSLPSTTRFSSPNEPPRFCSPLNYQDPSIKP